MQNNHHFSLIFIRIKCGAVDQLDVLDIGGSSGLDSATMQTASSACGITSENGNHPTFIYLLSLLNKLSFAIYCIAVDSTVEQAIFCGVTTVRLRSSGRFANRATIAIRPATEDDLSLMTAVCDA